jgi:hypothetical protein
MTHGLTGGHSRLLVAELVQREERYVSTECWDPPVLGIPRREL